MSSCKLTMTELTAEMQRVPLSRTKLTHVTRLFDGSRPTVTATKSVNRFIITLTPLTTAIYIRADVGIYYVTHDRK